MSSEGWEDKKDIEELVEMMEGDLEGGSESAIGLKP